MWLTAFGASTLRNDVGHAQRSAMFASGDTEVNPDTALGAYPVDENGEVVLEPMTAAEYLSAPIVAQETGDAFEYQDKLSTVLFVLLENTFHGGALATIAIGIATLCIILFL